IIGSINLGGNNDVLRNAGRIDGAVHLGSGDDMLELGQTSIIGEVVDLGDGDDRVILAFSQGATGTGQVASTVNAERLIAQNGTWRAADVQSVYDAVEIKEGAALTVAENADGELAITTPLVGLEGRLNLELVS